MSMQIRDAANESKKKNHTPAELLALIPPKVYDDGRTKQSFKDETDINRLLARAQITGTISHLARYEARYGDFSDFDFFESQIMLTKGREIFDALPSEIRSEFNQSQEEFFAYVNDPNNKDRLGTLLPELAEPGKQILDLRPEASSADAEAALAAKSKVEEPKEPPPHKEPLATPPAGLAADS